MRDDSPSAPDRQLVDPRVSGDNALLALVERIRADPGSLRGRYAALREAIAAGDASLHSLCHVPPQWIDGELERVEVLLASGGGLGLAGVAVGVKDTIAVPGLPTQAGTGHDLDEIMQLAPSPAVAALRAAGAVIVAKQATHQFASSAGPASTRSIRGGDFFAGGSTVGGAVAVAAGFTRLALGTDGGGSIRKPAALAGVAGLRPRKGTISDEGQVNGHLFGQSTGLIAPSAADIAAALEACPSLLAGPPDHAAAGRGRPVFGVPLDCWRDVAPAAADALRAAISRLEEMGCEVRPVTLWFTEQAQADFFQLVDFDNWTFHAPFIARFPYLYGPEVLRVMQSGERIGRDETSAAERRLGLATSRFLEGAETAGVDILLTPSVPWPDVRKSDGDPRRLSGEAGRFTVLANIHDLDSLSVPVARDRDGAVRSVMLNALSVPLSVLLDWARFLEPAAPDRSPP